MYFVTHGLGLERVGNRQIRALCLDELNKSPRVRGTFEIMGAYGIAAYFASLTKQGHVERLKDPVDGVQYRLTAKGSSLARGELVRRLRKAGKDPEKSWF